MTRLVRYYIAFISIFLFSNHLFAQDFITTWQLPVGETELTITTERVGGAVNYTWEEIPAGASGSGSFAVGTGDEIISGLPDGANVRLALEPANLKRFSISSATVRPYLQRIENWGTAQWTSMEEAFLDCENMTITAIDVPDLSSVTSMKSMFNNCSDIITIPNIESWITSNVTDMSYLFRLVNNFNQDISTWNTSEVKDMSYMFTGANDFNQDIDAWTTDSVADMNHMFYAATNFNQNLNNWITSKVTDMSSMFQSADAFNGDISNWNTSNVTDMNRMFGSAKVFNQDISAWETGNVLDMSAMFIFTDDFNQDISNWNTINVTNMSQMFSATKAFNQDIGKWNTGNVLDMSTMFAVAEAFNQDLDTLNTSNVMNMNGMFRGADVFNGDISSWNTSNVTSMAYMFHGADDFNQDISNWNTSEVTDMRQMFYSASAFDQNLNNWITSKVTRMSEMFRDATSFNQNLNSWDVEQVTDMTRMFNSANLFNGDISTWKTVNVTTMLQMFTGASNFDQDISLWNTENVTDMSYMFQSASTFNQNIGGWETNNVEDMTAMFRNAVAFNQNIGNWSLHPNVNMNIMLTNSGMDCNNYSYTLIGWSNNPATPDNLNLGATGREYNSYGETSRNHLISKGWTISGDNLIGTFCNPDFVTTWQLPAGVTELTISPERVGGSVAYTWEQIPAGASGSGNFAIGTGDVTISGLPDGGNIRLSLEPTNLKRFTIATVSNRPYLREVENWGTSEWTSMESAFWGCENMIITATDAPNLSALTTLNWMFRSCSNLSNIPNAHLWNTSNVTDMSLMFHSATIFNQDLSMWNTSNVTNMSGMFGYTTTFNQNLSMWNTSNVTNMNGMFIFSTAFNQDISGWNTSNVTDMSYMFYEATTFNQDISGWITGNVTNMSTMFRNAIAFDQPLNAWNTSNVTDMSGMFRDATTFNQDISGWITGNVTNMSSMFRNAIAFDQSLNAWNTSNVTDMSGMFRDAIAFNQDISGWITGNVTNMSSMFRNAIAFDQALNSWNTSNVTDMQYMFNGATSFNQIIGDWTLNAAVNMANMLDNSGLDCNNYSSTLIGWNNHPSTPNSLTVGATGLEYGTSASIAHDFLELNRGWTFIGDVASGNSCSQEFITVWQLPAGVTTLTINLDRVGGPVDYEWEEIGGGGNDSGTFLEGTGDVTITGLPDGGEIRLFIQPDNLKRFQISNPIIKPYLTKVEKWSDAQWSTMESAFRGSINMEVNATDVPDLSALISVKDMFSSCFALDNIPNAELWNISSVTNMSGMFANATSFNQDISSWNTSNVTDMSRVFGFASSFNQDISVWNTDNVTEMSHLFSSASSFNQNISNWNTSSVVNMINMFRDATAFNQNIGNWELNASVDMSNMLDDSGLDCENYSATLIGWNDNASTPTSRTLGASGLKYVNSAISARNNLELIESWTISGDTEINPISLTVPPLTDEVAVLNCEYFTSPLDVTKKIIHIDPNGNAFDFDNATVTISNNFVPSIPAHVTTHSPGTTGYYQTADGTNCFRLGRRMHSIEVPGTYTDNGGIKVRVYFNEEDTTYIRTDPSPTSPVNFSGWLKVILHDPQPIVNSMNTAAPELPVPSEIVFPIETGIEDGSHYADFLAEEFSTFVYYAATIIPLPITLSDWSIDCSDNKINLNWTTLSEKNNSHFIIEKSTDAKTWIEIETINGARNSNTPIRYSYEDEFNTSNSYYRLAQVDFDGITTYSKTIESNCGQAGNEWILFPNPNSGSFRIKNLNYNSSISIHSISGQLIWQQSNINPEDEIHTDNIPEGIYTISIESNNEFKHQKLVISR